MVSPFPVLSRTSELWYLSNASTSSGPTLGGGQQVAANPASLWKGKLAFKLKNPRHILEARGFVAGLDGMFGSFAAGPIDWRGQPWHVESLTGTEVTPGLAARSQAADPWSDSNPDASGYMKFTLAGNVNPNAVTLSVLRERGGILRRGQYLQIGDRLHIIVGLTTDESIDPETGRANQNVTVGIAVRPWLRAAYPAGTIINFRNPTSIMRLMDPERATVEMMSSSPQSDFSLDLVEAI